MGWKSLSHTLMVEMWIITTVIFTIESKAVITGKIKTINIVPPRSLTQKSIPYK